MLPRVPTAAAYGGAQSMHSIGWWVLAALLIVVGVIGTLIPAVPGVLAVFGGMLLAAWIDGFRRIGWITLTILGLLAALSLVADVVGSVLGAKRVGASRLALLGAAIGSVVGLFYGLAAALLAPFFGAAAGELISRRQLAQAARVGVGTWIGFALTLIARVIIVLAMLVVFIIGLLLRV
jgi:uncharacterized protein